ncbi:DNA polymerase epsilon catalytic subunit, variant 2, partial [Bonamia ostreae]
MYFVDQNSETFTAAMAYKPYFFVRTSTEKDDIESEFIKRFPGFISKIEVVHKEDLDMNNHLSGKKAKFLKMSFPNQRILTIVRDKILNNIKNRKEKYIAHSSENRKNIFGAIEEIREHDINFLQRFLMDNKIRIGNWYNLVSDRDGTVSVKILNDKLDRPNMNICAFDIETTKAPLRFPDSEIDEIMMISLMINTQGYLIVNRKVVLEDIEDFEYTPKPNLKGPFKIFNEKNEISLLQRFFELLKQSKPQIYVTYNGDFFDWPFIEKRCLVHDFNLFAEIGVFRSKKTFRGKFCLHLDAFCWVHRDSYLPIGSQGLKAVVREKMGYEPDELDPGL